MTIRRILVLSWAWTGFIGIASAEVSFNFQVRPVLSKHCIRCHGPDEEDRQAGFRIDRAEDALADFGDTSELFRAIPKRVKIVARITSNDAALRMSP